ncbi:MAG: hypothetical protein AAF089_11605 [Bacteroidota bacterium]
MKTTLLAPSASPGLSIGTPAPSRSALETLRVSLAVAALVYLGYIFTSVRIEETLRMGLAILLFGTIVLGVTTRRALLVWPVICVTLAMGLVARPLDMPNHHWMVTYLAAVISIATLWTRDPAAQVEALRASARWLLVVLMGFATVQKLLSPDFMDGSYIGFELIRGGFAGPVLELIPAIGSVIGPNAEAVQHFHETPPADLAAITLASPFPGFATAAYTITALTLLMEAWLCLGMWAFPKRRITHLSLILFIVTLAVIRQEVTFISVVCVVGLLACTPEQRWLRWTYIGLAVVTAAAVLKTLNL